MKGLCDKGFRRFVVNRIKRKIVYPFLILTILIYEKIPEKNLSTIKIHSYSLFSEASLPARRFARKCS